MQIVGQNVDLGTRVEVEVDNFLDSLRSPRTKEIYALHRKQFLRFVGRKSINQNN